MKSFMGVKLSLYSSSPSLLYLSDTDLSMGEVSIKKLLFIALILVQSQYGICLRQIKIFS